MPGFGSQGGTDFAIITNGLTPVFTNMVDDLGSATLQLNSLTTGTNKVTCSGSINVDRDCNNANAGVMTIGSGGVEGPGFVPANGTYGVATLSVAGNVKANNFGAILQYSPLAS